MIPSFIHHGKVDLQSPCSVPWNSMLPVADRQRLCAACEKVVHNITGLSPEQIFDLLQSDPGNVCVNFVDIRVAKDTETKLPKPKPLATKRLRYVATTAALLLLTQQAQNAPFIPAPSIPQTLAPDQNPASKVLSSNTIVSGIVVDRYNTQMRNELDVVISCEGAEITRVKTRGGMFACNLKGHAAPGDIITVSVLPGPQASSSIADAPKEETAASVSEATGLIIQPLIVTFTPGMEWQGDSWSGGNKQVLLADAQNIQIEVDYHTWVNTSIIYMGGVPPTTYYWDPTIMITVPNFTPVVSTRRVQDESCTDH